MAGEGLLLGVRGRLLLRGVSEGVCAGAVRGRRRGRGGHGEYPGRLLLLLLRLAPGSRSQVRRVLQEKAGLDDISGAALEDMALGQAIHECRRAPK